MIAQYCLLVALWGLWCALHSGLISPSVTEALRKRFPDGFRYYRLIYNLFAVATLLPVAVYSHSFQGELVVEWHGVWLVVPILLGSTALLLFLAGARHYDFRQFIGLRQIKDENSCNVLTEDCTLSREGVLSMVRHPWYSGAFLVVWARPLDWAAILTNIVLCGYLMVGALLEERKLRAQFGRQYADYQQNVSMLFPFKFMKRKLLEKFH